MANLPVPIHFSLKKDGYVTLVIDDDKGHRVRNLFGGQFFKAADHTVYYDGLDIGKTQNHVQPGTGYQIVRSIIKPGNYTVHGLVRDEISLNYQFTVYPNTGNPPWPTDIDFGSGGWLADHGAPEAVAFIPSHYTTSNKPHLILTAGVAEASQAVAWVDLQGSKFAGRRRIGGHWTGASHLAVDHGKHRNKNIYLYSAMAWNRDNAAKSDKTASEIRIMGFAENGMYRVAFIHPKLPAGKTWHDIKIGGIAIHNGILVYSEQLTEKLYWLDANKVSIKQQAKKLGEINLPNVMGMTFDSQGRLLVIVGNELHRYKLDSQNIKLADKQIIIHSNLDAPQQITLDHQQNIYISDQGDSHTVKVFGPDGGNLLRTIGNPGIPASGKYNPKHMNNPAGIAIDSEHKLWVTENFHVPKRVSVWSLDGNLIKAFYGPPGYGGGGMLDPKDPTRFYLGQDQGGMEFKIDLNAGTARLDRIYWLKSQTPYYAGRWHGPQFAMEHDGHRYVTSNYAGPTTGTSLMTIWRDDAQRITPLAFVGSLKSWPYIQEQGWLASYCVFANESKRDKQAQQQLNEFQSNTLVCWLDMNRDQQVQQDEVQIRSMTDDQQTGTFLTTHLQADMTLLITHRKGVLQLKPRSIDSNGLPQYDLNDATPIITGMSHQPTSGGGQSFTDRSGINIFTGGPMRGFKNDELLWQYHSRWPGLHPGHASPAMPSEPGELLATTRLLGPTITPRNSDAGEIWAINSDKGVIYLLTTDGLFVDYLGAYPREGEPWKMENPKRNMDVTHINLHSEHFFPTLTQVSNGDIYLVSGKSHSSLLKVNGLSSIQRINAMPLSINHDDVRKIQHDMAQRQLASQVNRKSDILTITRANQTITIDGQINDWNAPQWITIDSETFKEGDWGKPYREPSIRGSLSIDDQNLYIAIQSRQKNLIENTGSDLQTLFKTGGGIDLKLGTNANAKSGRKEPVQGDLRLLMTLQNNKPTVACYRYVVPGTKEPIAFTSPVRNITIDQIEDVSRHVKIAVSSTQIPSTRNPQKKNHFEQIEIAIPLAVLNWHPQKSTHTTGDLGVLIGKSGSTVERVYWYNKSAGIIADIPSEAMITPRLWGKINIVP